MNDYNAVLRTLDEDMTVEKTASALLDFIIRR